MCFPPGTSLHACGSATDLVVDKCIMAGASVVSCPCCYGGVTTSLGVVSYPRSQVTIIMCPGYYEGEV